MELNEQEIRVKTARIFRAARKARGLKQIDVSSALKVNQGTISKLENGILLPDAGLWYSFCQLTDIDPDLTYRSGYIFTPNSSSTSSFKKDLFYTGKHTPYMVKIKDCIPFINLIQDYNLTTQFEIELKAKHIDVDMFVVADYEIPVGLVSFIFDFLKHNVTKVNINEKAAGHFIQEVDYLANGWDYSKSKSKVSLRKLIQTLARLEKVFKYELTDNSVLLKLHSRHEVSNVEDDYSLNSYLSYKTCLLKKICEELLGFKNVEVTASNKHESIIQFAA